MKNVTVLVPTYNHGTVLMYQLNSLVTQSEPPASIVVLDDGSTDDTTRLLDRFKGNPSIKIIKLKKNEGVLSAHIRLLTEVNTPFFAFCAADDVLAKNWCEVMSNLLERFSNAKMAVSNTLILENGRILQTKSIFKSETRSDGCVPSSVFVESINKSGRLPPSNTIMYRSDIIDELIKPVFSRTDLGPITDVVLILAIATRYPVAHTSSSTGISIKSSSAFGNSFFTKKHLCEVELAARNFAIHDGFIKDVGAFNFLFDYIKYSWEKQILLRKIAECSSSNSKFKRHVIELILRAKVLVTFILHKRYLYIDSDVRNSQQDIWRSLEGAIDPSVLGRLALARLS